MMVVNQLIYYMYLILGYHLAKWTHIVWTAEWVVTMAINRVFISNHPQDACILNDLCKNMPITLKLIQKTFDLPTTYAV